MWKEIIEYWLKNQQKINEWETNLLVNDTVNIVEEIIDILDEESYKNKKKIKVIKTMRIKEAHEIWALHWVAHVWILKPDWKIWLQKRSLSKSKTEKWSISAAWHIRTKETPKQWWVRETFEELWITINESDLIPLWIYKKTKWKVWSEKWLNKELIFAYLLKIDDNTNFKLDEKEVEKIEFMDINIFERNILDPIKSKVFSKNKRYFQSIINKIRNKIT